MSIVNTLALESNRQIKINFDEFPINFRIIFLNYVCIIAYVHLFPRTVFSVLSNLRKIH